MGDDDDGDGDEAQRHMFNRRDRFCQRQMEISMNAGCRRPQLRITALVFSSQNEDS